MFNKITQFIKDKYEIIKPYRKNIIDPLLKILAIIIICAVVAHLLSSGETLADYARKNPETAYKSTTVSDN